MRHLFDSLTLCAVASELQAWRGAFVRHIAQPDETSLVLTFYAPGQGQARLLFDIAATQARAHLVSQKPDKSAEHPPNFCMTLRKYLDGGILLDIAQRGFDRILDLDIRGDEGQTFRLSCELMGRHSNLLLIGPNERILAVIKPISGRLNRVRELLPGRAYIAPPSTGKPDPRSVSRDEFLAQLDGDFEPFLRRFEGISPTLAREIAARADDSPESKWQAFDAIFGAAREGKWQPSLWRDENGRATAAYPLRLNLPGNVEDVESTNRALELFYDEAIGRETLDNARGSLCGAIRKTRQVRQTALAQVQAGTGESKKAGKFRRDAELILACLHQVPPGAARVELPDLFGDAEQTVSIALDPDLSPAENAQRLFARARHVAQNAEQLQTLGSQLEAEVAELDAAKSEVEAAPDLATLEHLRERFKARGWLRQQTQNAGEKASRPDFDGHKIKTFASETWTILVGENAEANDYLVRRVAESKDWWLHLRAGTSAHVVIRTNGQPDRVPPQTLQFAAKLCAQRSAARHAGVVAVDLVLRKYVRRPRKAAPGSVTYTNERTLHVGPNEEKT